MKLFDVLKNTEKNILLTGPGGSGKSSLLLDAFKNQNFGDYLLLYLDLRTLKHGNSTIINELISQYCGKPSSNESDATRRDLFIKEIKTDTCLLLDGLDEQETVLSELSFLEEKGIKLCVSSRYVQSWFKLEDNKLRSNWDEYEVRPLEDSTRTMQLNEKLKGILRLPMYRALYDGLRLEDFSEAGLNNVDCEAGLLDAACRRLAELSRENKEVGFLFKRLLPMMFSQTKQTAFAPKELVTALKKAKNKDEDYSEDELFSVSDYAKLVNILNQKDIVQKSGNKKITYTFHKNWVDFFGARFFANDIQSALDSLAEDRPQKARLLSGLNRRLNLCRFTGQLLGEHRFEDKLDCDSDPSPCERYMQAFLKGNNYCFVDEVSICIEIMKASRNDCITADYSGLNLVRVDFANCCLAGSKFHNSCIGSLSLPFDSSIGFLTFNQRSFCVKDIVYDKEGPILRTTEGTISYTYEMERRWEDNWAGAVSTSDFGTAAIGSLNEVSVFDKYGEEICNWSIRKSLENRYPELLNAKYYFDSIKILNNGTIWIDNSNNLMLVYQYIDGQYNLVHYTTKHEELGKVLAYCIEQKRISSTGRVVWLSEDEEGRIILSASDNIFNLEYKSSKLPSDWKIDKIYKMQISEDGNSVILVCSGKIGNTLQQTWMRYDEEDNTVYDYYKTNSEDHPFFLHGRAKSDSNPLMPISICKFDLKSMSAGAVTFSELYDESLDISCTYDSSTVLFVSRRKSSDVGNRAFILTYDNDRTSVLTDVKNVNLQHNEMMSMSPCGGYFMSIFKDGSITVKNNNTQSESKLRHEQQKINAVFSEDGENIGIISITPTTRMNDNYLRGFFKNFETNSITNDFCLIIDHNVTNAPYCCFSPNGEIFSCFSSYLAKDEGVFYCTNLKTGGNVIKWRKNDFFDEVYYVNNDGVSRIHSPIREREKIQALFAELNPNKTAEEKEIIDSLIDRGKKGKMYSKTLYYLYFLKEFPNNERITTLTDLFLNEEYDDVSLFSFIDNKSILAFDSEKKKYIVISDNEIIAEYPLPTDITKNPIDINGQKMRAIYVLDNNTVTVRDIPSGEEIFQHHIFDAVINDCEFVDTDIIGEYDNNRFIESLLQNGAIIKGKTGIE